MGWIYLFWNDLYISRFKYDSKEELYICGKKFIEKNLRENRSIGLQIKVFKHYLDTIYNRKINKQRIKRIDHRIVFQSIIALIILKQYEEEDLIYYPPKRKSIKSNRKLPLHN
tara:strand:+ start:147 stop:485 length:339 start_codon:yes stop_codon:yes gene_type:complete